ncbi:MAG: response regulator [Planctomycetota bacterium]
MKQHGGAVEISKSDSSGTQVDLYLSCFHLPQQRDRINNNQTPKNEKLSGTIIVCDDEPAILRALSESLQQLGLEVKTASNGDMAIHLIDELETVDLLLTDVVMPGKNGRDVCERFRQKFPKSSVVMMSGHGDSVLDQEFLGCQQATFLPKPFNLEILQEKLGVHLLRSDR